MINYNFHLHSNYSDGDCDPVDYVKKAIDMGFSAIGFSEHSPLPFNNPFSLKEENVDNYVAEINILRNKYKGQIDIYRGLEMDYIPAMSTNFELWKQKCRTDYLIGSVHLVSPPDNIELWFTDGPKHETYDKGLNDFFNGDIKLAVRTYYYQLNEMIETQEFDIVGHIDKIKMHNRDRFFTEDESWYQKLVDECLDLVKQKGLIVEVNTRGIYKKRSDYLFPDGITLKKIKNLNIPIVISSDAHRPDELNMGFIETIKLLSDYGFVSVMNYNSGGWFPVPLKK